MADNTTFTPGTGASASTDQLAGGEHVPHVKVLDGTADSEVVLKVVAEDAAHSTGDTGLVAMVVRKDTATALAGADGDYIPLIVDSTGRLHIANADLATLAGAVAGTEFQCDIITSALPTGAATSANQTTIIGHVDGIEALLATIDADTSTVAAAVTGTEMQVDVVTSALPTGASTAANQTTIIGHVDGIEALLGTIDSDTSNLSVVGGGTEAAAQRVTIANDSTGLVSVDDGGGALTVDGTITEANSGAIKTSVELIDNAIDGTEMQVDVVAALPVGANAIGKLAANSGVDIGDIDVLSIAAGENVVGLVGASDNVITVTHTLDTNAYADGDVLADTQEIALAARTSGGTVILESITILDKDDQAQAITCVFLDAATSIGTENAAPDITDANAEDILGTVTIATSKYVDFTGSQVATEPGIGLKMKTDGTTSLYVALLSGGTGTYTAAGLIAKYAFIRS